MTLSTLGIRPWLVRAAASAVLLAAVQGALAAQVSLNGNFKADDNVQFFNLTLASAGSLSVTSLGYGGGTALNGRVVAAGGFDTLLFLYGSDGTLLGQSDDGMDALVDPSTGLAADAGFTTGLLAAGVYKLALTQYDNFALGNLADGFSQAGAGNFTPGMTGCTAASFCDWSGAARSSAWALDISGDTLSSVVPEPGSLLLALSAAGIAGATVRRRTKALRAPALAA